MHECPKCGKPAERLVDGCCESCRNKRLAGGQNRSHAVMAQRSEPHDSLDDFPTPPWATRALCRYLLPADARSGTCLEPCANRGFMVRPLTEFFQGGVTGRDVHDYGCGFEVDDFLFGLHGAGEFDWIVMNPPFRLAEQFIGQAFNMQPRRGIAMIVRTAFLESTGRHGSLFSVRPPTVIGQFCERVAMVKGRCDAGASTATAYCWLVWHLAEPVTPGEARFVWIPPCRAALERDSDYDHPGGVGR